jgi:hypothetical protein
VGSAGVKNPRVGMSAPARPCEAKLGSAFSSGMLAVAYEPLDGRSASSRSHSSRSHPLRYLRPHLESKLADVAQLVE